MKHLLYASLILSIPMVGMEYSEIIPFVPAENIENIFENNITVYPCQLCDITYDTHYDYQKHTNSLMHQMKLAIIYRQRMHPIVYEQTPDQPLATNLVIEPWAEPEEQPADIVHTTYKSQQKQCPNPDCRKILRGSLKNHMLTHSGERPYHCSICFYKSIKNQSPDSPVSIIKVSHQKFICKNCGKIYFEKNTYLRHINKSLECESKL